ncbi:MAG: PhoH family protein, partial [Rhodospirillaceae bacterium]
MGKRSARLARQHESQSETGTGRGRGQAEYSAPLHPLGVGWDPIDNRRDQSYKRKIRPHNDNQRRLLEALASSTMTVALGPAGTGKTYLAIASAVEALENGQIDRILLSRPAVEAGENLGYLPGTLED